MKILLISPNIKGVSGGINRIQPPLGLAYLAAYLRLKHDVVVYDTAIEGWEIQKPIGGTMISIGESKNNISEKIRKINPDLVGISVLFSNLMDSAAEIAALCKEINPKVLVIVGGNYITNTIRDWKLEIAPVRIDTNIDYYFSGEAEFSLPQFIDGFSKTTPGLSYFKGNELITNPPGKFIEMAECLAPAWDLFPMEKYFRVGLFHSAQSYSGRVLPVMASRGCPEKCQFCTTPLTWGASVRWKDPQRLYQEIKHAVADYNIQEIQFQDDTLTANLKKLYQLCDYLKEFQLPWCTPNGIKLNYHTHEQPEMFRRMKQSGCYQITLACESGVQRVLDKIIRKNIKVDQFKLAIQNAKAAGLFVHTFWMVGLPGETRAEMEKTIEVASGCGADSFSVSIFTPLPGTPIYHQVIKENLWWEKDSGINNSLFRNSLIRVDGFLGPDSFEAWVDKKNIQLNSILEQVDPKRHHAVNLNRGVGLRPETKKIKQT